MFPAIDVLNFNSILVQSFKKQQLGSKRKLKQIYLA